MTGCPSSQFSDSSACSTSLMTWPLPACWNGTTSYHPVSFLVHSWLPKLHESSQIKDFWENVHHIVLKWIYCYLRLILVRPGWILTQLPLVFLSEWLSTVYKQQWFAMLRTEHDNDNGWENVPAPALLHIKHVVWIVNECIWLLQTTRGQ